MPIQDEIAEQRGYLLRFARLQLRNDTWAEDAVSETLLAALAQPQSFGNRAQLKTWLVGILKHKVIDALRKQAREVRVACTSDDADGSEELDALVFDSANRDHFASLPADWGDPEQNLRSRQFAEVLEACADKLPAAMARVFLMREWLELPVEQICKELGLTSTNLYVQLHRARLRLRACLELNWFGGRPAALSP